MPQLMLEMAPTPTGSPPGAVVWRPGRPPRGPPPDLAPHTRLHQVSNRARAAGVAAGMTLAQARSMWPDLGLAVVWESQVHARLCTLAEACVSFSPSVAVEAPDALVLDHTGSAHLFGGEAAWMTLLEARLRQAGHQARVAMADGPRVALAVARHGGASTVVAPGTGWQVLRDLPVAALGFSGTALQWLWDAGLKVVRDLAGQPRDALARRLGAQAVHLRLLDLALDAGVDGAPLTPHIPVARPVETVDFPDHPAQDSGVLVFWLKRAVDALTARLWGRGLAVLQLAVNLRHTREAHGVTPKDTRLVLPLALPLWNGGDMVAAIRPLLERLVLVAPVRAVTVEAAHTVERPMLQDSHLHPDTVTTGAPLVRARGAVRPEDGLARLWAELQAELGQDGVGLLGRAISHQATQSTRLLSPAMEDLPIPLKPARPPPRQVWLHPGLAPQPAPPRRAQARRGTPKGGSLGQPLRVLATPLPLPGWPRRGQALGPGLPVVKTVRPVRRLHLDWWQAGTRQDVHAVTLQDGAVGFVTLEPHSGVVALWGWLD